MSNPTKFRNAATVTNTNSLNNNSGQSSVKSISVNEINFEYDENDLEIDLEIEDMLYDLDQHKRQVTLNQETMCQLLAGFNPEDLRKEIDIDHVCKVFTDCQLMMNDILIEQDMANLLLKKTKLNETKNSTFKEEANNTNSGILRSKGRGILRIEPKGGSNLNIPKETIQPATAELNLPLVSLASTNSEPFEKDVICKDKYVDLTVLTTDTELPSTVKKLGKNTDLNKPKPNEQRQDSNDEKKNSTLENHCINQHSDISLNSSSIKSKPMKPVESDIPIMYIKKQSSKNFTDESIIVSSNTVNVSTLTQNFESISNGSKLINKHETNLALKTQSFDISLPKIDTNLNMLFDSHSKADDTSIKQDINKHENLSLGLAKDSPTKQENTSKITLAVDLKFNFKYNEIFYRIKVNSDELVTDLKKKISQKIGLSVDSIGVSFKMDEKINQITDDMTIREFKSYYKNMFLAFELPSETSKTALNQIELACEKSKNSTQLFESCENQNNVIKNDKSMNINYEDQHKIQDLDQISPMPSKRLNSKSSQESDDFMAKFFATPAKNSKPALNDFITEQKPAEETQSITSANAFHKKHQPIFELKPDLSECIEVGCESAMDFPSKMMQSTAVQTLKDSKSELNDSLDNLSAIEHNDSSLSAIDALIKESDSLKKKLVSLKKNILATESNKSNKSVSSVGSSFASFNKKVNSFQPDKLKYQNAQNHHPLSPFNRQCSYLSSPQTQNMYINQDTNEKYFVCTNLNCIPQQQQHHQQLQQLKQSTNLNCIPQQQYNPYYGTYSFENSGSNIIHYPSLNHQLRQNQNHYFPGSY